MAQKVTSLGRNDAADSTNAGVQAVELCSRAMKLKLRVLAGMTVDNAPGGEGVRAATYLRLTSTHFCQANLCASEPRASVCRCVQSRSHIVGEIRSRQRFSKWAGSVRMLTRFRSSTVPFCTALRSCSVARITK